MEAITKGEHRFVFCETANPVEDVRACQTLDIGGDAIVHVNGNARIFAWGEATIHVTGGFVHVICWGNANVRFYGTARGRIDAHGRSTALVEGDVFVIATEGTIVDAGDDVRVLAYGDAQIYATEHTRVTLHGYALRITQTSIEGNTSRYRGGYVVSHY